jgi:hypothetical protein
MRTIKKRLAKLENQLDTKEPSLIVIIRKVAPREQWLPPADNCPPGIRLEWTEPQDPSSKYQDS